MPLFQKATAGHSHPYFLGLQYVLPLLLCLVAFNSMAFLYPEAAKDPTPHSLSPFHRNNHAPTPTNLRFEDFQPVQNFQNHGGVSFPTLQEAFNPLVSIWNQQGFSTDTQEKLMGFGLKYYYESGLSAQGAHALSNVASFVWILTNAATPEADMGAVQFIYDGVLGLMPQQSTEVHMWYARHVFYGLYDAFREHPILAQASCSQLNDLFSRPHFDNNYLAVFHCAEAIRTHYQGYLETPQGQSQLHHAQGQVEQAIDNFHQWAEEVQVTHPSDHAWGFLSCWLWKREKPRQVHFPEADPIPILYRPPSPDSNYSADTETEDNDQEA